jgi:hypothetical protein
MMTALPTPRTRPATLGSFCAAKGSLDWHSLGTVHCAKQIRSRKTLSSNALGRAIRNERRVQETPFIRRVDSLGLGSQDFPRRYREQAEGVRAGVTMGHAPTGRTNTREAGRGCDGMSVSETTA